MAIFRIPITYWVSNVEYIMKILIAIFYFQLETYTFTLKLQVFCSMHAVLLKIFSIWRIALKQSLSSFNATSWFQMLSCVNVANCACTYLLDIKLSDIFIVSSFSFPCQHGNYYNHIVKNKPTHGCSFSI